MRQSEIRWPGCVEICGAACCHGFTHKYMGKKEAGRLRADGWNLVEKDRGFELRYPCPRLIGNRCGARNMPWRRANVCDDLHFMDYECRVFRLLNPSLVKAYLPGEKQTLENYIWQMRFKMTIASWLGRWPWGMGKSVNVLLSPR